MQGTTQHPQLTKRIPTCFSSPQFIKLRKKSVTWEIESQWNTHTGLIPKIKQSTSMNIHSSQLVPKYGSASLFHTLSFFWKKKQVNWSPAAKGSWRQVETRRPMAAVKPGFSNEDTSRTSLESEIVPTREAKKHEKWKTKNMKQTSMTNLLSFSRNRTAGQVLLDGLRVSSRWASNVMPLGLGQLKILATGHQNASSHHPQYMKYMCFWCA